MDCDAVLLYHIRSVKQEKLRQVARQCTKIAGIENVKMCSYQTFCSVLLFFLLCCFLRNIHLHVPLREILDQQSWNRTQRMYITISLGNQSGGASVDYLCHRQGWLAMKSYDEGFASFLGNNIPERHQTKPSGKILFLWLHTKTT